MFHKSVVSVTGSTCYGIMLLWDPFTDCTMISRLSQFSDHNVKLSKRLISSIKVSSHNCRQACHIMIYCGPKGIINKMFLQCCQYWSSPKTDTINGFHAETCPFILRTGTWYSCHKVIFLKEASWLSHVPKFMYDDHCINIVVVLFGILGKLSPCQHFVQYKCQE